MSTTIQRTITSDASARSRTAGLFLGQLDEQLRRLIDDTKTATPRELAWQPEPGDNTPGMLLAHIALVEVGWTNMGVLGREWGEAASLPLTYEEGGMPLASGAPPPANLAERDIDYFHDLLRRARSHSRAALVALDEAELARTFELPRPQGGRFLGNVSWVLYHLLEHFAGHHYQILSLRRRFADRGA
ncbi:MAG: DUF664 domain-containing protein [Candidatus Eisenbacteria bacterium]|uniref:DUF664 domain-containing protein n=1 Tax=Eiseniibacteriota bacterium TaxID=2212470 RepID=A0A849T2K2_UNCEI|nr:DUF664 domain-containing protein [Candidatus Eisenbacteria bacterium]